MAFYDDQLRENINKVDEEKKFYAKREYSVLRYLVLPVVVVCIFVIGVNIFMSINNFDTIIEYSDRFDVDPAKVASIIHVESKFDRLAMSSKDAYGLMQITYDTFDFAKNNIDLADAEFKDITEANLNIFVGTWYYSYLLNVFDGNETNALCAYNAGPTTVNGWLNNPDYAPNGEDLLIIPYEETSEYIHRINIVYPIYKNMMRLKF